MPYRQPSEIRADAEKHGLHRVLIVVAIKTEMLAVLSHLSDTETCIGKGGIVYECGRLPDPGGDWQVIVVQSGPGNHPAQRMVTSAHIDFQDFDLQVFVGIGGSLKEDIPIGSVVASERVYNAHAGKSAADFSSRPHSINAPQSLVQAAHKVSRDNTWPQRIRAPLQLTLPPQEKYGFPPDSFVGAIAAGEQVLAGNTNAFYQQIKNHLNDAFVVEMEGYGAMFWMDGGEGTPAIVIRGISDMCIGKTAKADKETQPLAAAHAAAFAFELIVFWGTTQPPKTASVLQPPDTPVQPASPDKQPRVTMVLSFNGSAEDYPNEKVTEILAALRDITGDPELSISKTEVGSFHIFLAVRPEDESKLHSEKLRQELVQRCDAPLIGVATEEEYRVAPTLRARLANPSHELWSWPRNLPNGTSIERPELQTILSKIKDDVSSVVVLLGPPGSGKSALLAQLCNTLDGSDIPFLAIKADVLSPSIETEEQLQNQLALPSAPSGIVESLSFVGPVVLIIDQLDALASFMDLKTGRLNVLLNLIRRLGGVRNVHIVLSARTFEYEHDVRLRSIDAESITLQLPPWHVVLQILEAEGIDAQNWPDDAREVLRYPQALKTLLSLKDAAASEPFHTYQAMLDTLWSERVIGGQNGPARAQLASDIAEAMSDDETLWLAEARYEDRIQTLNELDAAGIVTRSQSGASIGFRHQTLFDHALARTFVRHRGKLSSYILERQPSLFIRPKLWAALTYLRSVEPRAYEAELKSLWNAENLRKHLRILLIDFLGQQSSPRTLEQTLLLPELLSGEFRSTGFRAIAGSNGWFERLRNLAIAPAMAESADVAWYVLPVLNSAWTFAPDAVLSLIETQWLPHIEFDTHTWLALEDCPTWSLQTCEIASKVIARTSIATMRVDYLANSIAVEKPEIALTLIRGKLERDLQDLISSQETPPPYPENGTYDAQMSWHLKYDPARAFEKLLENQSEWNSLPDISEAAPKQFLQHLWPWYLKIFEELSDAERGEPRLGFSVPYRIDWHLEDSGRNSFRSESPLLASVRIAVERSSLEQPEFFLSWAKENMDVPIAPVQRLIAYGFLSNSARFADDALEFLISDTRRFNLGNVSDSRGTTNELIAKASEFWSAQQIAAAEKVIVDYTPQVPDDITDAESKLRFSKTIRSIRLELLNQLPFDKLSDSAQKLVTEERRAFPRVGSGSTIEGGYIGSPMDADEMRKASDADIVRIFSEIPDSSGWDHPRDWMRGGNVQLSRAFADFAKSNPDRAGGIMRQFKVGLQERAAGYAIDAMAEAADPDFVVRLISELSNKNFGTSEFRCSVASGIEKLLNRKYTVEEDIVQLLEGWLASEPTFTESNDKIDDVADNIEDTDDGEAEQSEDDTTRSVLWDMGGISILPHGNYPVLAALVRILLIRGETHRERLLKLLDAQLKRESDFNVWKALLRYFEYLRGEEIITFLGRLFSQFPDLAITDEGVRLLARLLWDSPEFVRDTIHSWPSRSEKSARIAYGELISLIAIVKPDQKWAYQAVKESIGGPVDEVRTGIASTSVNLWNEPANRKSIAAEFLVQLMPHANADTWRAISGLFRIVDELVPDAPTEQFLQNLAKHGDQFGALDSHFIVRRLQSLLPHNADLVGKIAQLLVESWKTDLGDMRTSIAGSANELVDLAVTLHRLGGSTRELGTSLFENLITLNAYGARETLDEIDNRFRSGARRVRPRLARSSRRRKGQGRIMRAGRN